MTRQVRLFAVVMLAAVWIMACSSQSAREHRSVAASAAERPPAVAARRSAAPPSPAPAVPSAQMQPRAASAPAKQPATAPAVAVLPRERPESRPTFEANAFPPTIPDTNWHQEAWLKDDCLRCHATGVEDAPRVRHEKMPKILLVAKCRSCHVLIPGAGPQSRPAPRAEPPSQFAENAFPPMIPDSGSHLQTWRRDDCLLCHESGIKDAPVIKHAGMPRLLLKVKCRTCHV